MSWVSWQRSEASRRSDACRDLDEGQDLTTAICVCVCVERERETCVVPEEFEFESFPLKYNHTSSEYKIHSVEVDLYYFNYL